MQLPVADTKKRKLKVWKAAEAVWRKALKLSIRVKWMEKDFTCRLQSYSLGHVWGGKSLDMTPEEELWQAVIPRLTLSSLPICTYCILVTVWGWTVLCLKKKKKKSHSAYWCLLYFITMLNELPPRLATVQKKMLLENTWLYWQLKPDNKHHSICYIKDSISPFYQRRTIMVFRHLHI